jgi:hypothetical protein
MVEFGSQLAKNTASKSLNTGLATSKTPRSQTTVDYDFDQALHRHSSGKGHCTSHFETRRRLVILDLLSHRF